MENNICTSVIANMAIMRNYKVTSDKIEVFKIYTDTMLFTKNKIKQNNNNNE
jgi:hypothetical protein